MIAVGKLIYNVLKNKTGLAGEKIYPLIAPSNITNPYIIYARRSIPSYTKDGLLYDLDTVDFTICTNDYMEGVEMAQIIRDTFENKSINNSGITVIDGIMVDSDEGYNDDSFLQTLTFNLKTK
jgi:hypothetical protein